MADRAQSETLGYVLVFAIMVSTIGVVYTAGFSGLTEVRDVERVDNAQRAFEVLADNVEDITRRNAPSRATEIRLADASLRIGEPVSVEVNVTGEYNATYALRPVVFDANTGTEIVFVQGAIIRQQGSKGLVVSGATMLLNDSRTVLPIVQTRRGGRSSVGGHGAVLIRAEHAESVVDFAGSDGPYTVWVNVTTPRPVTWQSHLEGRGDVDSCLRNGDSVSCTLSTDRVHVSAVKIDLTLE